MTDGWTVKEELDHVVDVVIDTGECGLDPTTVVDLSSGQAEVVRVGELLLKPSQRRIVWGEQDLNLTNAEYNLLEVLIQRAGQVVSKDVLSEQGLGRPHQRYDRSIDVHLSSIRRKLPPMMDGRPRIQAVLRKGYQLLIE